ncbi:alpha/beta fold hydrolase [Paenibacillus soyae]|uniref:Alpha/beta fold hydrolase n=1 Tax=Paenibacillus soyae TaxID=2969249 RepID=A0A9X2MVI7_9BACL|nr:alpha/beta fold hydrolase [Paenibacillus soyae]MCR2806641.1 alpha/beta fold hydrolase [Paenibacillus soyae]
MNLFITGGTGFIGKYVLAELSTQRHTVYVLVRSLERFRAVRKLMRLEEAPGLIPVIGDLSQPRLGLDPDSYEQVLESDVIIHAGGPMDIELGEEEARRAFLDPAIALAELALRIHAARGLRQFIHVVGFMSPFNEQNALMEPNASLDHAPPYEKMKFLADSYLRKAFAPLNIPLSTVNPSVVIGHSETGAIEQTGGLGILVDAVRRHLMPLVPGGKEHWLPMVHVDHVASFLSKLANTSAVRSDTYYLLDRKQETPAIPELIKRMVAELRVSPPLGSVPLPLLRAALRVGAIGKRLGVPPESMGFLVTNEFPVESKLEVEDKCGERSAVSIAALPFVITELDYQLSHPDTAPSKRFVRRRRAGLVTLEQDAPASGTPVLFLHGTFGGADCLQPVAERLEHVPIRLIDLPGFGRTPPHRHSSLIEGYVESVKRLVEELERPVVLVGHSFGGLIAARVMEKMDSQVERLLLLQPVLHPIHRRYSSAGLTKAALRMISERSFRRQLLAMNHLAESSDRLEPYARYVVQDMSSPRLRDTNAKVMAALTRHEAARLRPDCWNEEKVRILWGEADREHHIPEAFQRIETTKLPLGHQFPIEAPGLAAEWIRSFL